MVKQKVKKHSLVKYILLAIVITGLALLTISSQVKDEDKLLIIFAEALPYYVVNPNIEQFPVINELCSEGLCTSVQPSSPTFTTMQNYVIDTGAQPKNAAFAYNFVIDSEEFSNNNCRFLGENTDLGYPSQKRLNEVFVENKKRINNHAPNGSASVAEGVFADLPNLLKENDIVRTYVTDTDSHDANLSDTSPNSEIVKRFKTFDTKLGFLFDELKKEGVYDSTTLILYGDHGMAAINKFFYLTQMIEELEKDVNLSKVCYWNDAGTSLRFWIMENSTSKKEAVKKDIETYFSKKDSCFFVATKNYMTAHDMYIEDDKNRWINFGDAHIGVNVGCKVNTINPSGGMEEGFAKQQSKTDTFLSMHGYLDNKDYRMHGFLAIKPANGKQVSIESNSTTFIDMRSFIVESVENE
jgi:predicted AlkP superfamily pyrophosphatase or phosphodiesterase